MTHTALNLTHDPKARSWVASANGSDFPIQNLLFAVFRRQGSQEAFRGGVAIGDGDDGIGGPAIVLGLQVLAGIADRIADMGIKACRDQDQIGGKGIDLSQQTGQGRPPDLPRGLRRDDRIADIVRHRILGVTGPRPHGPLLNRDEQGFGYTAEGHFRTVAVMDIEIHHCNPAKAFGLGHPHPDGHIGKDAETHGPVRLGVMTRRANSAERPLGLATGHVAHGSGDGPGRRAQRHRKEARQGAHGDHAAGRAALLG